MTNALYLGDCLEVMSKFESNCIDTIITDPPYGLSFMGKDWDYGVPGIVFWQEMLRISKPGAFLLAFGGTRTYHRLTSAIEDAGWEIRDCVMWLHGQGFPKSANISKLIDKAAGAEREVISERHTGWQGTLGSGKTFNGVSEDVRIITAPATDAAKLWDGWGTALKPSWEPIIVAMKPLDGTFAQNAIKWGVAGINIDDCRIELSDNANLERHNKVGDNGWKNASGGLNSAALREQEGLSQLGRWPANVILDEVSAKMLDEQSGDRPTGNIRAGIYKNKHSDSVARNHFNGWDNKEHIGDSGGASRFFYCAKASKKERNIGLSNTYTVRYDVNSVGELCQKDVSMVLVELLKRVTSELEVKWLIGESGKSIMGLCQMDYLSTILTETNKITESKILNLLTPSFINDCIADANCEMENGGSLAESVVNSNQLQSNIIPEKMAALVRGVKLVVSPMLSIISDGANWKEMTNIHSTVKPLELMRYLVRLTKTPTGGLVFDPFMGSGTTGIACQLENRNFIGIEKEQEYYDIAVRRIYEKEDL